MIESGGEISAYSPTADVIRKQNEINQMLDFAQPDFDRVKSEMFRLAEMKYDCCTYNAISFSRFSRFYQKIFDFMI